MYVYYKEELSLSFIIFPVGRVATYEGAYGVWTQYAEDCTGQTNRWICKSIIILFLIWVFEQLVVLLCEFGWIVDFSL